MSRVFVLLALLALTLAASDFASAQYVEWYSSYTQLWHPYSPGAEVTHDVAAGNLTLVLVNQTWYYQWAWSGFLFRVSRAQVPAGLQAILDNIAGTGAACDIKMDQNGMLVDAW